MMDTVELYDWLGNHTAHGDQVRILIGDKVYQISNAVRDEANDRAILMVQEVGA